MRSEGSGYNHTRHITITSLRRGEKISDHYVMHPSDGRFHCHSPARQRASARFHGDQSRHGQDSPKDLKVLPSTYPTTSSAPYHRLSADRRGYGASAEIGRLSVHGIVRSSENRYRWAISDSGRWDQTWPSRGGAVIGLEEGDDRRPNDRSHHRPSPLHRRGLPTRLIYRGQYHEPGHKKQHGR
jgi:hypothetical protein